MTVRSGEVVLHVEGPVAHEPTCLVDELPGQEDPGPHVLLVLQHLNSGSRLTEEAAQDESGDDDDGSEKDDGVAGYLEHDDDMALVEDVTGRVDGDAGEVLDLLWVPGRHKSGTTPAPSASPVKVDVATVHQHVQLVPPLGVRLPHPHLGGAGCASVYTRCTVMSTRCTVMSTRCARISTRYDSVSTRCTRISTRLANISKLCDRISTSCARTSTRCTRI